MLFDPDRPSTRRSGVVNRTSPFPAGLAAALQDIIEEAGRARESTRSRGRQGPATGPGRPEIDGVYIISVAARILEMHPQTLRKYERAGLVRPTRTQGMLRLYSELDIARLRLIKHLVGDLGLNLAGVQLVLELFNKLVKTKVEIRRADDADAKQALDDSIDEMIALLYSERKR
ncbi:MAG: MerR family transcriptional regulator [Chloroflexota bacterium]|nr:MerR family transcriptional regulator [Chloroflexota bacterium]